MGMNAFRKQWLMRLTGVRATVDELVDSRSRMSADSLQVARWSEFARHTSESSPQESPRDKASCWRTQRTSADLNRSLQLFGDQA